LAKFEEKPKVSKQLLAAELGKLMLRRILYET